MGYLLRLVILVVLAWLAYRFIRRLWTTPAAPQHGNDIDKIKMVPCAKCGVHVPENEAVRHRDKAYCSQAHLEADE